MRIFLIGFMTSGKSYWGKEIAQKLSLPFIDLDDAIEKHYRMEIPKLFDQFEEKAFRVLETEILSKTIKKSDSFVMSCGGGTITENKNRELIKLHGISIFINTDIDTIISRLEKTKTVRPLLANLSDEALKSRVNTLMDERRNYYEMANYRFDPQNESLDEFLKTLKI